MKKVDINTLKESASYRKMLRVQMLFIAIAIAGFSVLEFSGIDTKKMSLGFGLSEVKSEISWLTLAHLFGLWVATPMLIVFASNAYHFNLISEKTKRIINASQVVLIMTILPMIAIFAEFHVTATSFLILLISAQTLTVWGYTQTPLTIRAEPS